MTCHNDLMSSLTEFGVLCCDAFSTLQHRFLTIKTLFFLSIIISLNFQIVFTPSFELLTLITTGHNVNAQDEKQVLSIFTSLETFSTLTAQTCLCIYL